MGEDKHVHYVTRRLLHEANLRTPGRVYITLILTLVILPLSSIIVKHYNFEKSRDPIRIWWYKI